MTVPTEELAAVAAAAVRAGGDYLESEFRSGAVAGEYGTDDVKADADREAERRVLAVVADHFPTHATHGEESGRQGEGEYVWVVDPLDGTNNFAAGLPSFATAVTAVRDGDPVAPPGYEPLPDTLYLAERGGGVTVDGDPVAPARDRPLDRGTVSLVVGLSAIRDPDRETTAHDIEAALRDRAKRVIQTWSPTVDWGLVATGGIEGVVAYYLDVYEQYPGELLAAEAGLATHAEEGLFVAAGDAEARDALLECLPA